MLRSLIAETLDNRLTLVHGDYSPKNILVHHDALVLLDHEVIHIGDPAFDVGFALAHFLSKAHHLPTSRDNFAAAGKQFWSTYSKGLAGFPWHSDLEARAAGHTLACLLARVAGRSPLEYLSVEERGSQREGVLAVMQAAPTCIDDVVDQFLKKV
jgi:aminoglycoside phosphotransferase (APT) family kinase protein